MGKANNVGDRQGALIRHLKRRLLRFKWKRKGLEELSYVTVAMGEVGGGDRRVNGEQCG